MAVERTVQINIQTNAEEAARSINSVEDSIKAVKGASAGANQQMVGVSRAFGELGRSADANAGLIERASGRLLRAFGGVGRTVSAIRAPFRMLGQIGAVAAAAAGAVNVIGSFFGAETQQQRQARKTVEEAGASGITRMQSSGQSGAGVRSLLEERKRLMRQRGQFGGGITDFFQNTIGIDPSFGAIQGIDDSVAAIDKQIAAIEQHASKNAEAAEEIARLTRTIVRTRAR